MAFILVVDDAVDIRVLCREVLVRAGHETVTVGDGPEALTYLERAQRLPDLVLLDVQMPAMDGWEVLSRIRADPKTRELRVVMFSVRSRRDDVLEGYRLGCDGYVGKPFNLDAWIREIEAVLGREDSDRDEHRAHTVDALAHAEVPLDEL
jgi:CheY-like chemotaxis protein